MKYLPAVTLIPLVVLLGACSTSAVTSAPGHEFTNNVSTGLSPDSPHETMLIVSREDGSVVMQTIQTSADLCFKTSYDSATTCLTQGEPVIDPTTDAVIGFEMIEERIDLVAKTD